ncbi:MAG: FIST C-terminal domain-containing protein [Burkholderiales bacterium]|nr:FIST C-terminal domain-containing protein [Burkholderiales bacterium]
MSAFRAAHARGETWQECVAQCTARLGRIGGGLGFVYFTEALVPHAAAIVESLREKTGVSDWIGTVGVGIIASGTEYLDEPALAVMVAELSADQYQVFSGRARLVGGGPAHFGVIHADPRTPDVAELIADMSSKVESGFLVGGLSSSRAGTVQVANEVISGGLSGAVLGASVGVSTRLTQGCTPLPGRFRVTGCQDNIIRTLDGRPALDVMKEAIGEMLARDLRRAAHFIHVGLPVAGSDRGDYLVRNLMGIDAGTGLIAIGDLIEPGAELLFCKRDAESARRDLRRILSELREELPDRARGALYFSCVGRGENMFGSRGAELALVKEALGELPLAGFFCNGEISHDRLYGYTGVLTLFH